MIETQQQGLETAEATAPSSGAGHFRHTCVTCRVMFADGDTHRDHFKTDWHRYNLKRKMAELPAISAETFRLKVDEMKQQVPAAGSSGKGCKVCSKFYQTDAAFENHCKSKKHLEMVAEKGSATEIDDTSKGSPAVEISSLATTTESFEVVDQEDEDVETSSTVCGEALAVETCLFCNATSASMDENLKHMSLRHGFFIVDAEYCVDLEGLATYLGQKVGEGFVCLWCNGKGRRFRSLDAVQKHMLDKCHCKMYHDGEAMLEYSDFYDYSPSYPDADKVSASDAETDVEFQELEEQGYELVLPSGATIGHRSLLRYYKQNLRPTMEVSLVKKQMMGRLLNQYRAIGWTGTTGEAALLKARDLKLVQKIYTKQHMRLGVKANKLQAHFRSQIGF